MKLKAVEAGKVTELALMSNLPDINDLYIIEI
jgi:hypothetical protein